MTTTGSSSHRHTTQGKESTSHVHTHDVDLSDLEARIAALEAGSSPLPGRTQVFYDDFPTWDPTLYFIYPPTWTNSNGTGRYGAPMTVENGILRILISTDATGTPRCAALCPLPEGSLSNRGDLPSMRVEYRLRADRMPGYKGVPLLWPMSGNWPTDGEINWPESHFDQQPRGFMHRQDGTSGSDQEYVLSPAGTSWQDWHTYVIDWKAGEACEFLIDGVSVALWTERVPETPMHLVMQFETQLTQAKPDPSVSGFVEIDYIRVWA